VPAGELANIACPHRPAGGKGVTTVRETGWLSQIRDIAEQRGVSGKVVASVAIVIVVLVGGYLISSGSAEDLLSAQKLSPKQIRIVATKLLLHEDVRIRTRASEKLYAQGAAAVPILKDIGLKSSDLKLRLAVFGVLASLDPDAAVEILEEMSRSSDPEVRGQTVRPAAMLKTPRAVAVIEKALTDPDTGVRSSAAGTMGSTGAKSAIPALTTALKDPEFYVRKHAARSLKELTGIDYSSQIAPQ
jgi:hypothetical protein